MNITQPISIALQSLQQLEQKTKELLTEAQQSGSSCHDEAFKQLPDDLEELDELLQDARAKLEVHSDADTDILIDYDRRTQEVI